MTSDGYDLCQGLSFVGQLFLDYILSAFNLILLKIRNEMLFSSFICLPNDVLRYLFPRSFVQLSNCCSWNV